MSSTFFRVLHVSDFHIGAIANRADPGWILNAVRNPKRAAIENITKGTFGFPLPNALFGTHRKLPLEDLIRIATEPSGAIDFVVCTGDMASTGNINDLNASFDYFKNGVQGYGPSIAKVRDGLLKSGKKILFMPGNHDRYGAKGAPGNKAFDLVYQKMWATKGKERIHHIVAVKNGIRLIVIAADFSLRQKQDAESVGLVTKSFTQWGQGKCYSDILNELCTHTTEVREKYSNASVVWAVHFPPSEIADKKLKFIDGQELLRSSEKMKVGVILSGHVHEKMTNRYSYCVSLTAGTCSAVNVDNKHEAHILTFEIVNNSIVKVARENLHIDGGVFSANGIQERFETELEFASK